jgi:F-type H+-transporting ATPase subunit delta
MKTTRQTRREATQLFRLCLVDGRLDEGRGRQIVQRLVADRPRGYLATLSLFRRLVKLESDRRTAKVESAMPLSADLQAKVQAGLERAYGPGLNMSFAQNPALIGGMRVQVGSDVYNGSVKARLAALEQSF